MSTNPPLKRPSAKRCGCYIEETAGGRQETMKNRSVIRRLYESPNGLLFLCRALPLVVLIDRPQARDLFFRQRRLQGVVASAVAGLKVWDL